MLQGDDTRQLQEWLALLHKGSEGRNRAVAEMRNAGADRLFPHLLAMLSDIDPEVRCLACEAIVLVDGLRALESILPLLDDPDVTVRWFACGCLHDFADERAVTPLIRLLQTDSDAQVRGTAAYALGGIGSPAAIPALLTAMESDHEFDELGHSASSAAATALDDILDTSETRLKLSSTLCQMQPAKPDLDRLRRLARERYQQWTNDHS